MRSLLSRAALSLLGGTLGGVAAAALDARWAVEGASSKLSTWDVFVPALALDAPVALVVSAACALAWILVSPRRTPTLGGALGRLRDDASRELSATVALGALAVPAFVVLTAHAARGALAGEGGAKAIGAELAATAVLFAGTLVAATVALARPLARRLTRVDARVAPALGVALAVAIFALGITRGTPGGDGGALGVLGVLKRQELDLRAPGLLLLLGAAASIGPSLRAPAALAAALSLAPLALLWPTARSLDGAPAITAAVERGAPLARTSLRVARRLTDRDRDGFSRTFGGGDCDDRDARVYPTAIDEPENGVDEDCSGADARRPAPVAPPPTPPAPAARVSAELNVLLVTVDTLRADLGYAGNPRPLSPNLDKLAAGSTVFERAVSLASYTGKSVGPMLIGKYPSETHRGWSHFNAFPKDDRMVQERLQAASVRTLSVQAHWYFDKCCGLARGFDVVDSSAAPGMGAQQDNDTTTTGDKLTDAAIKRLSDPAITGGRFFAWVHYLDPHADYLRHDGVPDFGRDMRAQYDHEVAFTDREVGRLLDFVAAQPWGARTAVILTSDHGEAFGEHKLIRHGIEVWEELVRVPLIVRVPGAAPRRVAVRRGAIDLVPTILDLLQVRPAYDGGPSDFVSGVSLLPDVLGGAAPVARDVLVDMPAGPNNDEKRAFYRGEKKLYISSGVAYSLYDLAKDPGEREDLASTDKATFAELRAAYEEMKARLREVRVKPVPR